MIPSASHPAWAELIKGEQKHRFALAAASLLFFNLQCAYRRDPSRLREHIEEARRFFTMYESILADDLARLFG